MKHVVSISLGSSSQDFDFITDFLGEKLHVRRIGSHWQSRQQHLQQRVW